MVCLMLVYALHKGHMLSLSSLHHAAFGLLFRGCLASSLLPHVDDFLAKHLDRLLYLPAIHRLRKAQAEGHFVAILSSSPDFLVSKIAEKLSVADWHASHYFIDRHQKFSHISLLIEGDEKALLVREYAEKLRIAKTRIAAYSDSYLDLPFLQSAGIVIGVNPDRRLRRLCLKNCWKII